MPSPQHSLDVGPGRHTEGFVDGRCRCCRLPFREQAYSGLCNPCRDHYEIYGEDSERRDRRLIKHHEIVYEMYTRMERLLGRNEQELKEIRGAVASALRSRDHWKRIVDRIQSKHFPRPNGECTCGTKSCDVMKIVGDRDARVPPRFNDDW